MWPCYLMGIGMLYATWKSEHKDLLRIEKKRLLKFSLFLVLITIYRYFIFKLGGNNPHLKEVQETIVSIPLPATLLTYWEDACHGLPLAVLGRVLDGKWYRKLIYWPALAVTMLIFGLGHVYQGIPAATLLAFYVPFSTDRGKKYGFGTVILCHMLYDFSTVLSVKWMMGL